MMEIGETFCEGYGRCVRLCDGGTELLVTVDRGPRIIHFGFLGGPNELAEDVPFTERVKGGTWRCLGGHRLWHSPEAMPRTYIPDNDPVEYELLSRGVRVIQRMEPWTQIEKSMEVLFSEDGEVRILHRLTNRNAWEVRLAAWAITQMAQGGLAVVPQTVRNTGFLSNRNIRLWPYSRMEDARVHWGDRLVLMEHRPEEKLPFKFGCNDEPGWAACFNHGNLFIKRFIHDVDEDYPDGGCSFEVYINGLFQEMESLSPLKLLAPGESLEHLERWSLIGEVERPAIDEGEAEKMLASYI